MSAAKNEKFEFHLLKDYNNATLTLSLVACNDFYNCSTQFYSQEDPNVLETEIKIENYVKEDSLPPEPELPEPCTPDGNVTMFSGPIAFWPEMQAPQEVNDKLSDLFDVFENNTVDHCRLVEIIANPPDWFETIWGNILRRVE